jgi:hypothetical protein
MGIKTGTLEHGCIMVWPHCIGTGLHSGPNGPPKLHVQFSDVIVVTADVELALPGANLDDGECKYPIRLGLMSFGPITFHLRQAIDVP